MEALSKPAAPRLPWFDESSTDVLHLQPDAQIPGDELRSVVTPNARRCPTDADDVLQGVLHVHGRERRGHT